MSGQGLEVYSASGTLVFGLTTKTGRIIDKAATGAANGSVTAAALASGTPFYYILPLENNWAALGFEDSIKQPPSVSFSGTTMTWTYPGSGSKLDCLIYYGVAPI